MPKRAFLFVAAFASTCPALLVNQSSASTATIQGSKPAILIYWERGYSPEGPPVELEFAVWENGQVLWRDKPKEWIQVGGKWQWTKGRHFKGTIDPARVAAALQLIRKEKVFGIKNWHFLPPDASCRRIEANYKGRQLTLMAAGEPPKEPPYRRDPAEWSKGRKAWKLIRDVARVLTPKKGAPIPPQDISKWR